MVLIRTPLGGGALRGSTPASYGDERGSQALEFAMVVPLLGLLLGLLAQTGLLLADVIVAHGVAREAARAAAVAGLDEARRIAHDRAGTRDIRVELDTDDGAVTAAVELASGAFAAVGVDVWLPATATFHVESPLPIGIGDG